MNDVSNDRESGRSPPGAPRGPGGSLGVAALILALLALSFWQIPRVATGPAEVEASVAPATPWLSLPPATEIQRIAFGSCLHQAKPQPIWQSVQAAKPQLFLMLGDAVYGDVRDATLGELRQAYVQQAAQAELARLRAAVPVLATWDDHDYGKNDAGAEFPWQDGARRLFAEFWQIPRTDLPAVGVYRSRVFGPPGRRVQIILLDTRSFRGPLTPRPPLDVAANRALGRYLPSAEAGQSMLGAAQWTWLENQLRQPADIRVVVSSIQVLADTHGWERWGNLPAERERLFALIERTKARGVVLLSGDRHRAAIYRKTDGRAPTIPEITSSALNLPFESADAPDSARLGDMYWRENFGMLTIDWQRRRLGATLNGVDGQVVAKLDLAFADLGL